MSGREQLGPYVFTWPDGVFPLGEDTLSLGKFVTVRNGWKVCDLGTGSGTLLLLLSARAKNLTLAGVDRDELAVRAARSNLANNGLAGEIVAEDLRTCSFDSGKFDLVVSNPPYFFPGTGGDGGGSRMSACTVEQLCECAARLLKNRGRFALCHRPERLTDLLCALRQSGLEPKRMKFLVHSPAHPPFAVLVEAVRQGNPGLEILPVTSEEG